MWRRKEMSIDAMKQALEVIEAAIESGDWQIDGACDPSMAIHSLYEAIAEAEQPDLARVGEVGVWGDKREWVGLTDEDIDLYGLDEGVTDNKAPAWLVTYARGIEAKLKEKNVPQP
jgi:hypothetical protein